MSSPGSVTHWIQQIQDGDSLAAQKLWEAGVFTKETLEHAQYKVEADKFEISEATVKTHLEHIYRKLGVADRASAVGEALRTGLVR